MELNGDIIEEIELVEEALDAAIFAATDYVHAGRDPHDILVHALKAYVAANNLIQMGYHRNRLKDLP